MPLAIIDTSVHDYVAKSNGQTTYRVTFRNTVLNKVDYLATAVGIVSLVVVLRWVVCRLKVVLPLPLWRN